MSFVTRLLQIGYGIHSDYLIIKLELLLVIYPRMLWYVREYESEK